MDNSVALCTTSAVELRVTGGVRICVGSGLSRPGQGYIITRNSDLGLGLGSGIGFRPAARDDLVLGLGGLGFGNGWIRLREWVP